MLKRHFLALIVAFALSGFVYSNAHAEDSTPSDTPTTAPAPTPAAANAAGLGPQTQMPAGRGGSNADGSALQPAGNNPLQSTTSASTGLTAPSANTLQAPATTDAQLQVLAGESDGEPIEMAEDPASHWGWLWLSLLIGLIAAGASIVWRDRQRFRQAP